MSLETDVLNDDIDMGLNLDLDDSALDISIESCVKEVVLGDLSCTQSQTRNPP